MNFSITGLKSFSSCTTESFIILHFNLLRSIFSLSPLRFNLLYSIFSSYPPLFIDFYIPVFILFLCGQKDANTLSSKTPKYVTFERLHPFPKITQSSFGFRNFWNFGIREFILKKSASSLKRFQRKVSLSLSLSLSHYLSLYIYIYI